VGGAFFGTVAAVCAPAAVVTDLDFQKKQTGDPNFEPPGKLFLRLSLVLRWSFHTASRFDTPN
jgi:hypothetical protein